MTAPSPDAWDKLFKLLKPVTPSRLHYHNPGDKMHKLAGTLTVEHPEEIYLRLVSHWQETAQLVPGSREPLTALTDPSRRPDLAEFEHRMMLIDALTYLSDDILVKVDRAAMGVSLETRIPLLDHEVVEFAWRLPLEMKIRGDERKRLLRQLLYRHVPSELIDRPKMGFGIPLADWLREPLRDWSESLLDPTRLRNEGWFDADIVQRYWKEHLAGQANWSYLLWNVLSFQAWLEAG